MCVNHVHAQRYVIYIRPVRYVIITLGVMVVSGYALNKVQLLHTMQHYSFICVCCGVGFAIFAVCCKVTLYELAALGWLMGLPIVDD
jgi:hypothetical protein